MIEKIDALLNKISDKWLKVFALLALILFLLDLCITAALFAFNEEPLIFIFHFLILIFVWNLIVRIFTNKRGRIDDFGTMVMLFYALMKICLDIFGNPKSELTIISAIIYSMPLIILLAYDFYKRQQ